MNKESKLLSLRDKIEAKAEAEIKASEAKAKAEADKRSKKPTQKGK